MTRERVAAMPSDDHRGACLISRSRGLPAIWSWRIAARDRAAPRPHSWRSGHFMDAAQSGGDRAIVGMRSAKQVEGVIGAAEFRLSPEEVGDRRLCAGRRGLGGLTAVGQPPAGSAEVLSRLGNRSVDGDGEAP